MNLTLILNPSASSPCLERPTHSSLVMGTDQTTPTLTELWESLSPGSSPSTRRANSSWTSSRTSPHREFHRKTCGGHLILIPLLGTLSKTPLWIMYFHPRGRTALIRNSRFKSSPLLASGGRTLRTWTRRIWQISLNRMKKSSQPKRRKSRRNTLRTVSHSVLVLWSVFISQYKGTTEHDITTDQ